VLEAGPIPADTIAGSLLADYGAEVIRLGKPGGDDPMAAWWGGPYTADGVSLVHKVRNRNKLMATLDLSNPGSTPLFRQMVQKSDVVLLNFRPGTLERWGLSPEVLQTWNPNLIVCLLSAFGQSGPYRDRPGDGRVAEAFAGHAYLNGNPDGPPLISQMDMGGSLAGSWSAMGIVFALYWRDVRGGRGQVIDVAAYEPMFRQIQQHVISYTEYGITEKRAGNRKSVGSPWVASETTSDGKFFTYSASTRTSERDQLHAMGLQTDPRFADVDAVEANAEEYRAAAKEWIASKSQEEVLAAFECFSAAGTPVLSGADLIKDDHILARELVVTLDDPELGSVRMQGVVPKFSATPGAVRHAGRKLGADNERVYRSIFGLTAVEYQDFQKGGIV
jgi:crotonobetainyl-CoA:carnitine CoA-transferase CaiB-like acyl-CoA transferase